MNERLNVIIIHGTGGSPEGNWFPWLANELRTLGHEVHIPKLPTPEKQSLTTWMSEFKSQIGPLKHEMVLVGHSLGVGFILSLLENSDQAVSATFFVSGFIGRLNIEPFDTLNKTFVCKEFDWLKIQRVAGIVTVINSDDDPYVPIDKGEELAQKMGAPLTIAHSAGHINAESGYTSYPDLLRMIASLVRSH